MSNRYLKKIEEAAGVTPPVPDATQVYQSSPPVIPRKKERGYQFTKDGLDLKRDLTRDEFRGGVLPEIEAMNSAQQLNVGDSYLYGVEHGYIEGFDEMAELTGYAVDSIKVYASICRNVPKLIRINPLTFKHYQFIAPLPDDEKPHWISYAASNALSSGNLKKLIDLVNPPQLPASIPAAASDDSPAIVPVDAPALSDEIEEEESTPIIQEVAIKEVKKQIRSFVHHVETDSLREMKLYDLYLLKLYVDDKYNLRRKMGD